MNKTFKKVLSIFLCVIMLFGTASVAFAADGITYGAKYFQKSSTNELNADIVLDKLDELLKEADIKEEIEVAGIKIVLDLTNINGLCKTIDTFKDLLGNPLVGFAALVALGDIRSLNLRVWQSGMKRGAQDVQILNELLELLSENSGVISKIVDNSINLGILGNFVDLEELLGKDGVPGLIKGLLVGLVYDDENSAEYKTAYAKALDNFIFEDVIGLINKEDGALPGFTMNANSTVDNVLLSLFNSAWNKYVIDLIKGIDVDFSTSENEALRKIGEVINLNGASFDPASVQIDLSKSFESQINDILGAVVKFFFPAANWENGGKDKLAGNLEQLYVDLAAAFEIEANPLSIVKYVLSNLEVEGIEDYIGDFESWTSIKQGVAAVLLNTAKKEEIPVKESSDYETILGDMLTYVIADYVDLGYGIASGKDVWNVLNDILNVFLVDKGFAKAFGIGVKKTDTFFEKLDIIIDMTGTKLAAYSSEEFIKGIIEAVFDFDIATAVDKTVLTFLNDFANDKVVSVLYDAVYTLAKKAMGNDILVARATATPFENAISKSSLKTTVKNLLGALNGKKADLLPPVLYVAALILNERTAQIAKIADQTYTGKALKPALTVTIDGKTLKSGTDYTAEYSNNTELGTATVTVTGINQFEGTLTANFNIVLGKVTGLKATAGKTDSASLSWTAVAGAQKYEVSCNGKTQTVTTNKATVSGLTAGKEYKATVKAIRNSASTSASVSFVTNPAKVTGLKTTSVAATSVKLSWTKVANATSYEIQSSTDGKTWSKATTSTTNSATVSSLKANTSYKFRVRAVTKASAATTYGEYASAISAKTLLATVTGLKASKTADTSVSLTWTKVTGATGYIVSYSTDGKTWTTKKVTTNTISLTGLKANTAYQVKVCAYDKADVKGANSSVLKVTTLIAKVTGIKFSEVKPTSFKVTWTKVAGADSYTVEYSKDGKSWTKKTVKTNSISLTKLSANTSYQVRVTAYKGKTAGPVSAVSKTSTLLAAPTSLKASKTTKDSVTLTWKKVTGAAGYEIYRNGKKVGTVNKGATVTFTDKKLAKNTTYKYTVKAYKVVSGKNVLGAVSSTVSAKTKSK